MQPQNTPELIDWLNVRFTRDEQQCLMICASPVMAGAMVGDGHLSTRLGCADTVKVGTLKACADIPVYSCKLRRAIVIVEKDNPEHVLQIFKY